MQFRAVGARNPADIMASRETVRAEYPCQAEKIREFRTHIAPDAGNRRSPAQIFVGKSVNHIGAEAGFVIEDIMRNAEPIADGAGIANVAAGTAAARPADRLAMIVELERNPDRLGAGGRRERGHYRAVDAA